MSKTMPPRTLLWDGTLLMRTRAIAATDASLAAAVAQLRADAADAAKLPLQTVTSKRKAPEGGDLHDYVTYSSYTWPCTATCNKTLFANCSKWVAAPAKSCNKSTGLPWVGHDGYNDPAAALDRPHWSAMVGAVNALSASAFFLNESDHADRAAHMLRAWFLHNATRMRPAARFAQQIPGLPPRAPGLIDFSDGADPGGGGNYDTSVSLAHLLDSARLLEWAAPQAWAAADVAALEAWVAAWLEWVLSPAGNGNSYATNNIGSWYDSMTAASAFFVGNRTVVDRICAAAPTKRIGEQVAADGALPAEDQRTKSESYHNFALVALLELATICPALYSYETPGDGRSLRGAVGEEGSWTSAGRCC